MSSSKDPCAVLNAAEQAVTNRRFKTAVRKYAEYLKLTEPDPEMLLKIADVCQKADDNLQAIEYLEWASRLKPDDPKPLMDIARLCNSELKHNKALTALEAALAIAPPDKRILLQTLFTLREISVTSNRELSTEETYQKLIQAATLLIEIDPQCCKAYCYRALGRMRLNSQDLRGAQRDLDVALKLDSSEPLAHYYKALLHIEDGEFPAAFNLLERSFAGFQKEGSDNFCGEISSLYHHYQDKAIWAKRQQYRGLPIEKQMQVLSECGIRILQNANPEAILSEQRIRDFFEDEDPFHHLLIALVGAGLVSNGVQFDTECIYATGDYARFVKCFRELARGTFPAADICDHVAHADENARAEIWLSFSLDGKTFKWKPCYRGEWLDLNILRKLAALAAEREASYRFALVPTAVDTSDYLLRYLTFDQLNSLRSKTGIKFESL